MTKWSVAYVAVFAAVISNAVQCSALGEKSPNSSFVPTREWQKVGSGQALPPGLHVRINLHTGEKEAKLPDPEGDEKKSLMATSKGDGEDGDGDSDKAPSLDPDRLKEMLKNIKPDDGRSEGSPAKKFRSYEKLKEDFDKLKIQVKSDFEILVGLIENFRKYNVKMKYANNMSTDWTRDEDIISTLVDLEYLVHQYNNAQEFARLNGFSDVVYKSLNSTNGDIRSEALKLLGSATNNNPKVQIAALEAGGINVLIKILTFDEDLTVRSRSLFALSSLVRRFPAAQQKLISDGGLTAFAKIFDDEKQDLFRLQVKLLTLLHDLLFERKDAKMSLEKETSGGPQTDSEVEALREKLRQYEVMNLEQKLVEQEWCKRISDWFMKQNYLKELFVNPETGVNQLDNINYETQGVFEKVLDTLFVLSDICRDQFHSDIAFVNLLFNLRDVYSVLSEQESKAMGDSSNQFFNGLANILNMLTEKILENRQRKDEL